ncbi:plasma membrane localization protein [Scheffersomyces spartinae]|uniref:Protein EFR3 n=1 Tax=Scheffersomyces spartinae TaxID=45513 RepID=A0A9P8AGH1_9ASCO|nr:plasma membrane localization protein [Scheffersomyces spartinae]KAG7191724.1 plasma membrane localization protein [Scheffersomyces spartinae]
MFKSKHQKLILQCYPPGKGVDKKPNPSELSYLLYYASTRRVKLEKVVTFLDRKTKHDTSHNRTGNLQVTLAIVSALIEKCSDNLNSFAVLVSSILNSIILTNDLALCKNAIKTYRVLCNHLDGGLFTGDQEFVMLFTSITKLLIGLGSDPKNINGPNTMEWKMISLMCCRHVSNCIGFNVTSGSVMLQLAVPLLVSTIHGNSSQSNLLTRLNSNVNIEFGTVTTGGDDGKGGRRLSKVTTAGRGGGIPSHITQQEIDDNFENDNVLLVDLTEEAYSALKSIFNTNSTLQISDATRIVVHTNFEAKVDQLWGTTFLEMCTIWIPVQLRFATLSTLLIKLMEISKSSTAYITQYDYQKLYANYVLGLISSDVNMIGLSISDIMQQLLSLQSSLFLTQSVYLSDDDVEELSSIYSLCIEGLSTHIYYHDQICDSIDELLSKVDYVLQLSFKNETSEPSKIYEFLISLLGNISTIFKNLHSNTSSITRTIVDLDHWDISLSLLNCETNFEGISSNLDSSELNQLKLKYLNVFNEYLNNELLKSSPSSSSEDVREIISTKSEYNYLEPDIFQYISMHNNMVNHLFASVDKMFNHGVIDEQILKQLVILMNSLSKILGINFLVNFIPFFYHWTSSSKLLLDETEELNSNTKSTIAYGTMYTSLSNFDGQYKQLDGLVMTSDYFKKVETDIRYLLSNQTWASGYYLELDSLSNINILDRESQEADVKSLQEFIGLNDFTSIWIQSTRPLILNVHDANGEGTTERSDATRIFSSNYLTLVRSTDNSLMGGDGARSPLSEMSDAGSFLKPNGNTNHLGLGSATDINSIHSGLVKPYNGTIPDGRASYISPRINDLKDAMNQPSGGILKKQMLGKPPQTCSTLGTMNQKDISTILDDLDRHII